MTLPLHLQMEIDLAAQTHHREIANAFFEVRAAEPGSLAAMVKEIMTTPPPPNPLPCCRYSTRFSDDGLGSWLPFF